MRRWLPFVPCTKIVFTHFFSSGVFTLNGTMYIHSHSMVPEYPLNSWLFSLTMVIDTSTFFATCFYLYCMLLDRVAWTSFYTTECAISPVFLQYIAPTHVYCCRVSPYSFHVHCAAR